MASIVLLLRKPILSMNSLRARLYLVEPIRNLPRVCCTASSPCHEINKDDRKLFPIVTRVLKSLKWSVARGVRFSTAVELHGFSHSMFNFRIMIYAFALADMDGEVFSLLRDMVEHWRRAECDAFALFPALFDTPYHLGRSEFVINLLIKVFASNQMLENAVDVYFQSKRIGYLPDIRSSNFLLKCLVERNKGQLVQVLFEDLKKFGPRPNVCTHTIMIQFFYNEQSYKGDAYIGRATIALDEIVKSGTSPTSVTYRAYIHGLCKWCHVETALKYIDTLRREDQPINAYCYNAILHKLCQDGKIFEALKIFEGMKRGGLQPDVYSYSILIDGLCKDGKIEQSLIDEFCRTLYVKKAWSLFKEMIQNGLSPTVVTYTCLIDGYLKSGYMDITDSFFEEMKGNEIAPDRGTYAVLIAGYRRLGRSDKADETVAEMRRCRYNSR